MTLITKKSWRNSTHTSMSGRTWYLRAHFNKRNQLDSETAREYTTALYGQIKTCKYGDLKEQMLRDRFVVGIWDTNISQKLQMNAKLTLEDAKKIRQREAVRERSQQLQTADKSSHSMGEVSRPRPHRSWGGATSNHSRQRPRDKLDLKCTRCDKPGHKQGDRCPAK